MAASDRDDLVADRDGREVRLLLERPRARAGRGRVRWTSALALQPVAVA